MRRVAMGLAMGLAVGSGCFSDSAPPGCTAGEEGCLCRGGDPCDGELECRSNYCVQGDCTEGELNCSCDAQGLCTGELVCVDGAICHEPEPQSTSGTSVADTGDSTQNGTTIGSTTSDSTTANPSTTSTTDATSGPATDTGAPTGCADPGDCPDTAFCDFDDGMCGQGELGSCEPRPLPESCSLTGKKVCGCDGSAYNTTCHAQAAGVDVGEDATVTCQ